MCTHPQLTFPEYITTLEGDIAERDRLIDAIRGELGSSQSENAALRQEIGALKKALLACADRAESPVLPPPGPIPAVAPASRVNASSALVTPNTQKDLPSSPRLAASPSKAFWGGSASFGGITPVHTTLIPENFIHPLANVKWLAAARAHSPVLQENINPNPASFVDLYKAGPFDTFADANALTMKTQTSDAYVSSSIYDTRHHIDHSTGTGTNFGLAWLRFNRVNPSISHLSMARLLASARMPSRHHECLHILFVLSLVGSMLPRIRRHLHHRNLARRLFRSRTKFLRHNRPYSPQWSHRHSFNG